MALNLVSPILSNVTVCVRCESHKYYLEVWEVSNQKEIYLRATEKKISSGYNDKLLENRKRIKSISDVWSKNYWRTLIIKKDLLIFDDNQPSKMAGCGHWAKLNIGKAFKDNRYLPWSKLEQFHYFVKFSSTIKSDIQTYINLFTVPLTEKERSVPPSVFIFGEKETGKYFQFSDFNLNFNSYHDSL